MKTRIWLIIPWALFLLIAGGWIFYWFAVAGEAEHRLALWAQQQRQQGGEVTYARVQRHGFPVLMHLEVDGFHYRAPRGHWTADTARFDLHVEMIDPGHLLFEAKAPIAITHQDGAINTINATSLIASLHMRGAALKEAGIEASDLNVTDSAKPGVLHAAHAVVNVRPDPRAADQYQAAFTATALTLARPVRTFEKFGQDIANLEAGVVIEHGAALMAHAPANGDALAPWRDAGGKARFEFLRMTWGPLEASGQGEAGLDDQRRLIGHVRFEIPHPAPALSALAESDNLSHDAKNALGALAIGFVLSGRHVSFDVDARDGALRIENVPVRQLAPLY